MYLEKNFYKIIPANSEMKDEYIIPDGKTLYLSEFSGEAAFREETFSCIDFNGEILFATHASSIRKVTTEIIGDGVKKLTTALHNDTGTSQVMGGNWIGRLLDTPDEG